MPWNEYYIKRPKLLSYHELACSGLIAKRFLDEARTLELIRHNPYPNIAHFAGCVVESDRIVGLALTRYSVELGDRIRMAAPDHSTRPHAYMATIVAGLEHLHSLVLAHKDLKPPNIMLNEQDVPVIVDFGSCKPLGETFYDGGSPGWDGEFRFCDKS